MKIQFKYLLCLGLLILYGCSYNWTGNTSGIEFLWKQSPQISFYTSMIFWVGLLIYAFVEKSSGCLLFLSVIIVLALIPILLPKKIIIDQDKITFKYSLISLKSNKEIKFEDIISLDVYDKSKERTKNYGTVGTTGTDRNIDYGISIKDKNSEIIIPFAKYYRPGDIAGILIKTPFKYLFFGRDFNVKLKYRNKLIFELKNRLPRTVNDSINWIDIDYKLLNEEYWLIR
jgi:hypothetical protein